MNAIIEFLERLIARCEQNKHPVSLIGEEKNGAHTTYIYRCECKEVVVRVTYDENGKAVQ